MIWKYIIRDLNGAIQYLPYGVMAGAVMGLILALCAYSLDFTHPGNGKKMSFRVKPQNPAFEKFTKIPSEDIFEG